MARVSLVQYAVPSDPALVPRPYRLAPSEAALLSPRAADRRRAEFLAGRVAAKVAVQRLFPGLPGEAVQVLSAHGVEAGRPLVQVRGRRAAVALSISHEGGLALAAAASGDGARLGLDVVRIEPLGLPLRAEAFAAGEWARWARWLGSATDALGAPPTEPVVTAFAFAAKEAALKWLGLGLRASLHSLTVTPLCPGRPAGLPGAGLRFTAAVRYHGVGRVLPGRLWCGAARAFVLLSGAAVPRGPSW